MIGARNDHTEGGAAAEERVAGPRARSRFSLRRQATDFLRRRLRHMDPPPSLRLVFWNGEVVEFASNPRVTITIGSPRLLLQFARGNMTVLGDAFAKGEIVAEGSAEDIVTTGMSIADAIGMPGPLMRFAGLLTRIRRPHSRRQDQAAISHHYDVSNDFYRLWLDRNMVYSCAYFRTGSEDIDTAQQQKLAHICRKLRLKSGDRLLDIGCGWGGLLRFAASHYDVTGTGITLSREQYEYARRLIAAERLADRIEIRLQDFRDLKEAVSYDKIVSVGMYEHVGIANLPLYFSRIGRLLREDGILLNHGVATTDPDGHTRGPPGGEFIDRHVFPGGELPHLSRVLQAVWRAGLEPADLEDLRPHYGLTLRHWVHRLEAKSKQAAALAGIDRYQIWRVYMAGMAEAFERGWLTVAQIVAYKRPAKGMPKRAWTREHQYGATDGS